VTPIGYCGSIVLLLIGRFYFDIKINQWFIIFLSLIHLKIAIKKAFTVQF